MKNNINNDNYYEVIKSNILAQRQLSGEVKTSNEENINYNELPLAFEDITMPALDDEEHTVVRCLTSNNSFNNNNDYNEVNNSFGSCTPITKKHSNYINFLRDINNKKLQPSPTLLNSASSPSLLNNIVNNSSKINSNKSLNRNYY